jgi:hypothetical protein
VHRDLKPQHMLIGYENDGLRTRSFALFPNSHRVNQAAYSRSSCGSVPPSLMELAPVHCFRSHPLHWAQLRDNSCALHLRVFCFSGSSQQIF